MSGRRHHRILFAVLEPGYFRLYGSTILELGRRGHDVRVAFDRPEKREGAPLVPAGAPATVQSLGAVGGTVPRIALTLRLVIDYLRYLDPAFGDASYLRRRAEKHLPAGWRFLRSMPQLPRAMVSAFIATARGLERLIRPDESTAAFVRRAEPDVVVVTPVVAMGESGARQTELVKAARTLGIPVVVGVASWDHLTSKGLVRILPDAITVWNDVQAREAHTLHRVPRARIIVTGAQPLDHWFTAPDAAAAAAFRASLGIGPEKRVLLFVGSSRNMAPEDSEPRFVRRWLEAIRASDSPAVRDAFVIVRPHPSNTDAWRAAKLAAPGAAVVPAEYSGIPMTEAEIDIFRRSLLACDAVVGINTTAMIEAAIVGRPVLTVRDAAFVHSQEQTLHAAYLPAEAGGCALVAADLDTHARQLAGVLADSGAYQAGLRAFVARFVRPRGLTGSATKHLCDAIEQVASGAAGADVLLRPALEA